MAELLKACAANDTERAMEILEQSGEELNIDYSEVFPSYEQDKLFND